MLVGDCDHRAAPAGLGRLRALAEARYLPGDVRGHACLHALPPRTIHQRGRTLSTLFSSDLTPLSLSIK
jgi:hypothetical protein